MTKLKSEYLKIKLSNGIKCILYPRTEIHSFSISSKINVGSLDEDSEVNGISHLMEHLAFDGTKAFTDWQSLNFFLNDISGSSNAYTADDQTKYYGTFPQQYLEEGIKYISEVTLNPLYNVKDIKKEVDIILDEKTRYDDSVDYQMQTNIVKSRYINQDTAFSRDVIGSVENLKKFTKKDIAQHHKKYYIPENIEIFMVGNFDLTKTTLLLEQYFGNFKSKQKLPEREYLKSFPEYSEFTIKAKQKLDINQYYLVLNFPSPEFIFTKFEERYLLSFLSSITASQQHQSSILWRRLREELGIVYDVSAWSFSMMSRSLFAIDTNFNPEYLETVLREIYNGINIIKAGKEGEDIFERRKKRLIDTELIRYDNPSNILDWIISQEEEMAYHGRSLLITEYIDLVKSYKFKDVIKLANKVYDWNKVNIVLVTKDNSAKVEKNINKLWAKIISEK